MNISHTFCVNSHEKSQMLEIYMIYMSFSYMRSKNSTFKAGNANTCFDISYVTHNHNNSTLFQRKKKVKLHKYLNMLRQNREQTGILHFCLKMM
jgi:hypothetical protein